jgi:hypothetical protein
VNATGPPDRLKASPHSAGERAALKAPAPVQRSFDPVIQCYTEIDVNGGRGKRSQNGRYVTGTDLSEI